MPAVSAQTPLQPEAGHGSPLVAPAMPIDPHPPVMPGPNALTSDGIRSGGGAGSPLVSDAQPMTPGVNRTRNGGEVQAPTSGAAWPTPTQDHGSAGDAPSGALGPDMRCIDIPPPPTAAGGANPFSVVLS